MKKTMLTMLPRVSTTWNQQRPVKVLAACRIALWIASSLDVLEMPVSSMIL